jgi:hypothetical protein
MSALGQKRTFALQIAAIAEHGRLAAFARFGVCGLARR